MLQTERLDIRAFRDDGQDMEFMMRISNEPQIQDMAWVEFVVPRGPKFKETITHWINTSLLSGIVTIKDGTPIGNVAIAPVSEKNREGSLVINILPEFWGKGYGPEVLERLVDHAFRSLALHRFSLHVFAVNQRAISTYKKLGFVEEGRMRKAVWWNGSWIDIIAMALLEEEWFERCAKNEKGAAPTQS